MNPVVPSSRRVLIIDDDPAYGRTVYRALQKRGYAAFHAATGTEGSAQVETFRPHLILLDLYLPDTDGIELYKTFRQDSRTRGVPIILMTGEAFIENVLKAISISLNADEVYSKGNPNLNILMERVQHALAAETPSQPVATDQHIVRRGRISADLVGQKVWVDGQPIPSLGARRFALLCVLLRNEGPTCRADLLREVWAERGNLNLVEVTINRLRQDLERLGAGRIDTTAHGYELICDS
ncbi:MAG: response regulator transcription factor [Elusimicrobiota bacterium]